MIFIQEHSTKAQKARALKAIPAERGWRLDLGPVDETTESASAGFGAMWNPGALRVYVAPLKTERAKAHETSGRLRKYAIQHVHGNPIVVYNVYGWTDGSKDRKARVATEAIMREISLDVRRTRNPPYWIVGDLNGEPEEFQDLKEVMDKEILHDVGGNGSEGRTAR